MSYAPLKINQKITDIQSDIEDIMKKINYNKALCLDIIQDKLLSERKKSDLIVILKNKVKELHVILEYKQYKLQDKMREWSTRHYDNICETEITEENIYI